MLICADHLSHQLNWERVILFFRVYNQLSKPHKHRLKSHFHSFENHWQQFGCMQFATAKSMKMTREQKKRSEEEPESRY